ncbi:MAG TPA: cyanophycin synthetase, partial [Acidobacteriota bacterium]|nr:cyanophycin synthetase [Acidobacteriota bacterium]
LKSFDPSSLSRLTLENGFPVFEYVPWNRKIRVNLRGRHQALNAGVALLACDVLQENEIGIQRDRVIEGLNEVVWAGRLDLIQENPPILLDCAHNPMGAKSLAAFLKDYGWKDAVVLFTAMKDKKISTMLHQISRFTRYMILTRVEPFARCATEEQLEKACTGESIPHEFIEPVGQALKAAISRAQDRKLPLVIFGSIYLAGEILKTVRQS